MKSVPRIRLRTLFLLFFCAAVGLTAIPDPLSALAPTVQTAMIIGLAQQTRRFIRHHPTEPDNERELRFARLFAVVWRVVVAATLAFCILRSMLLSRGLITATDRESILILEPLQEGIPTLCMIIVICNSLTRWRSGRVERKQQTVRSGLLWLVGVLIALIMLVEGRIVEFLVHRATANIEAAQRAQFRRPGVYVGLATNGYATLWIGLAAVTCLIAAGLLAAHWRAKDNSAASSVARAFVVLLVLVVPILYCIWYYGLEVHRLSPELAGAGLAPMPIDWIAGSGLAIMLAVAGAYRMGCIPSMRTTITHNMAHDVERTAFHESLAGLALLAGNACYLIATQITELLSDPTFLTPAIGHYVAMFCYPTFLLKIAVAMASFQFCWTRWKNSSGKVPEELVGLSPTRFFAGFVMLAAIVSVGVPTLEAFIFTLWLGPYDLYHIFWA